MSRLKRFILPTVILLAGVTLMIFGILRGELHEIYHRGTIICLECIGIG